MDGITNRFEKTKPPETDNFMSRFFNKVVSDVKEYLDWDRYIEEKNGYVVNEKTRMAQQKMESVARVFERAFKYADSINPSDIKRCAEEQLKVNGWGSGSDLHQFGKITIDDLMDYADNLTDEKTAELKQSRRDYWDTHPEMYL